MGDRTPAIRDAASLILLHRDDSGAPLVLMGNRHPDHKFLPNDLVFPGGKVDPEDGDAPVASPLRDDVLALLCRGATAALARGLGHAAARELAEETGLTLGQPPALAGLDYLCRAVTPAIHPIRFNARFFVAGYAEVGGTLAGSGELEFLAWYRIDALRQLNLGTATRAVLEQLEIWLQMPPAARAARKIPVFIDVQWREE